MVGTCGFMDKRHHTLHQRSQGHFTFSVWSTSLMSPLFTQLQKCMYHLPISHFVASCNCCTTTKKNQYFYDKNPIFAHIIERSALLMCNINPKKNI